MNQRGKSLAARSPARNTSGSKLILGDESGAVEALYKVPSPHLRLFRRPVTRQTHGFPHLWCIKGALTLGTLFTDTLIPNLFTQATLLACAQVHLVRALRALGAHAGCLLTHSAPGTLAIGFATKVARGAFTLGLVPETLFAASALALPPLEVTPETRRTRARVLLHTTLLACGACALVFDPSTAGALGTRTLSLKF